MASEADNNTTRAGKFKPFALVSAVCLSLLAQGSVQLVALQWFSSRQFKDISLYLFNYVFIFDCNILVRPECKLSADRKLMDGWCNSNECS